MLQFGYFEPEKVRSHPEVRTDLFNRDLNKVSSPTLFILYTVS